MTVGKNCSITRRKAGSGGTLRILMAGRWFRVILMCCVPLALAPGCQHLPWTGGGAGETARPPTTKNVTPAASLTSATPARPETIAGTDNQRQVNPLPAPQTLHYSQPSSNDVKPQDTGRAGMVTIGDDSGRAGMVTIGADGPMVKPIAAQVAGPQVTPPPLPPVVPDSKRPEKREYASLLKALQCILEERHPEAIQHLSSYDPKTQEIYLSYLSAFVMLVKKPIDELSPGEIAVLCDQLSGILEWLRPRSELAIKKMCLCRSIRGYGSYDPLPDNYAFLAGSADRSGEWVQVYVELKNVASELTAESDYLTKLGCTLELSDASGKMVWSYPFPRGETTDRRKARLNDFYKRFDFWVPAVSPGMYVLTIQVADETNPELRRTAARKSVDFRVTPVGQSLPR